MSMGNLGRARYWVCAAILVAAGCSSSTKKGASAGDAGDPFGNVPGATSGAAATGHGGSGSSSGTSGVGANGGKNANGSCAMGQATTSKATPRVILVLDGSCSMSTDYPSTGRNRSSCAVNPNSRWSHLRSTLLDPTDGVVTQLQDRVEFGLVVFGTKPMCPLTSTPIQPALNNLAAITSVLGDMPPGEYTPTGAALDYVFNNLVQPAGAAPDTTQGPEIVLLATDGEPNSCGSAQSNFQPSIDAVTLGRSKNVTTYVISLASDGGQYQMNLQNLANLGVPDGKGHLYEPANRAALSADLASLVGGAIGCDLALNGAVTMGKECMGSTVTLTTSDHKTADLKCNDANGWILVDSRHIRVQGTACDLLKSDKDAYLSATFACGVFRVE